jgi:hypothetical protein
MFGGLFVNRAQAFKYALFENGHHPETIVEVSREIELDIPSGNPQIAGTRRVARCAEKLRRLEWLSFAALPTGSRSSIS